MTIPAATTEWTADVLARRALASRLRTVATVLLPGEPLPNSDLPEADAGDLLERLIAAVSKDNSDSRVWLLLTGLAGGYPLPREVEAIRRRIEFDDPLTTALYLMDSALSRIQMVGEPLAELELVVGGVLADVDHSAKYDLHTGIQRVARNLLPVWHGAHPDVVPVAWTDRQGGLRRLDERERERILEWSQRGHDVERAAVPKRGGSIGVTSLVVPWRSVVVLVEVPAVGVADRVAGLGLCSGNRVVAIGYDAIPVVSADMVPPAEAAKFTRYLTAVKATDRVAGISATATAELAGFVRMLPTQGLTGPIVGEVSLPSPAAATGVPGVIRRSPPMVLVVGSHEPRKNHLAVLHAAEILWREGVQFSLEFIGGSGWGEEFPRRAAALTAAGRAIQVRKGVSDADLDRAYAEASFTVFPSVHEGYGLPVAESLAHGTPAITSNFGSTAEIGAGGGALLVDPRNDRELTDAMRTLLTGPAELARLRAQIAGRTETTWTDYARALWEFLVAPELIELTGGDVDLEAPRATS